MKSTKSIGSQVSQKIFVAVFVSILGGGISLSVAAGTDVTQDTIPIRENNVEYNVTFALGAGEMVSFADGEDCGDGHKTSPPAGAGRFYSHIHVNYTLDQTGTDENGTTRTVTSTNIRAYWDDLYSGYDPSGSEDVKTNCHAHAMGKSVWIQDPSYIDADEYEAATDWGDTEILRNGMAHSIKVTSSVSGTFGYTVKTSEKNGASRIYSETWGYSNPTGATTKMKKK